MARRKKTHEEYILDVLEKRGENYQVLTTYKGSQDKVKVLHRTCGTVYEVRADGLLGGSRCKACLHQRLTKTHDEFVQQVKEVHNDRYEVVSEYTGALKRVDVLHKECGRVRSAIANSILQGSECVYCFNESRVKTQEEFEREVYDLVGTEYLVKGTYTLSREIIEWQHNTPECGLTFKASPNSFLSAGNRCPHCAYSKGEYNIQKVLDKLGLTYEREKEYADLVNIRPLRFDFYIPEYNLLIEFDGEQHEKPIAHFGGIKYFKYIKENDAKKDAYCEENKIHLMRIPYSNLGKEEELIINYIGNIKLRQLFNRLTLHLQREPVLA